MIGVLLIVGHDSLCLFWLAFVGKTRNELQLRPLGGTAVRLDGFFKNHEPPVPENLSQREHLLANCAVRVNCRWDNCVADKHFYGMYLSHRLSGHTKFIKAKDRH